MLIHLVDAFIREDLIRHQDSFRDFIYDDGNHRYPAKTSLDFTMTIQRLNANEFQVQGEAVTTLVIPCDRCLEDVDVQLEVDFDRSINLQDEDDHAYIDGMQLDVKKFLTMELLSKIPQKVLCSEDCKGLCEQCGANLNEHECSCETGHIDIRLAHLKDLFNDKFKEV